MVRGKLDGNNHKKSYSYIKKLPINIELYKSKNQNLQNHYKYYINQCFNLLTSKDPLFLPLLNLCHHDIPNSLSMVYSEFLTS